MSTTIEQCGPDEKLQECTPSAFSICTVSRGLCRQSRGAGRGYETRDPSECLLHRANSIPVGSCKLDPGLRERHTRRPARPNRSATIESPQAYTDQPQHLPRTTPYPNEPYTSIRYPIPRLHLHQANASLLPQPLLNALPPPHRPIPPLYSINANPYRRCLTVAQ